MARLDGAWQNEDGAVAPLVGLSLFALIAAAGIAFDYSRIAGLDTEMQNAADQAALVAASQLTNSAGATSRADAAAKQLLDNLTLLGNDNNAAGRVIEITETVFYQTRQQAVSDNGVLCPATDITDLTKLDELAAFVCVRTVTRTGNFALTPVVAAFSGDTSAMAVATIESAVCNTPPLMICNPTPGQPFTTSVSVGSGVRVTGHGNIKAITDLCKGKNKGDTVVHPETGELVDCGGVSSSWAPGDFGFLKVGDGKNEDLVEALAFQYLDFDCTTDSGQQVSTGNPQSLYDAINTRFDIYDFAGGNGTTLAPCLANPTACPGAVNSVKDLVNGSLGGPGNNKKCGLANGNSGQGWDLPSAPYWPKDGATYSYTGLSPTHDTAVHASIEVMGFPRDLCHYASYTLSCGGTYPDKIGTGDWGRYDYWDTNHNGQPYPTGYDSMTRYQTYQYELANGLSTDPDQYASRQCSTGPIAPGIDRRVLTVAIVNNCSALSGASTAADIGEYVDMFLVQPVVDGSPSRGNGDIKDSIYMEYIGISPSGANGLQAVVKQVPLLIK